jgi:hypothetical protein
VRRRERGMKDGWGERLKVGMEISVLWYRRIEKRLRVLGKGCMERNMENTHWNMHKSTLAWKI